MSEFNKYSTDGGATFIDVEDKNAVHWADYRKTGVNNVLPFPYTRASGYISAGVTFTINSDRSVSANNIATGYAGFELVNVTTLQSLISKFGTLRIKACPSGGGANYKVYCRTSGGYIIDEGNGILIPSNATITEGLSIQIVSGYNPNGLTFYPMLLPESVTDFTYVMPGIMTNSDLTKIVQVKSSGNITSAINTLLTNQGISGINCTNSIISSDEQRTFFALWFERSDTTNDINPNIDLSSVFPYDNKYWTGGCVATRDNDTSGMWWIDANSSTLRIRLPKGSSTFIVNGFILNT